MRKHGSNDVGMRIIGMGNLSTAMGHSVHHLPKMRRESARTGRLEGAASGKYYHLRTGAGSAVHRSG